MTKLARGGEKSKIEYLLNLSLTLPREAFDTPSADGVMCHVLYVDIEFFCDLKREFEHHLFAVQNKFKADEMRCLNILLKITT